MPFTVNEADVGATPTLAAKVLLMDKEIDPRNIYPNSTGRIEALELKELSPQEWIDLVTHLRADHRVHVSVLMAQGHHALYINTTNKDLSPWVAKNGEHYLHPNAIAILKMPEQE